ncbi:MAG TPA: ATP-binding protein [Candidatus Dormibacteraeota bacterium]|nr:ATP-binding protein [Candidatus Dormibacteraeota bacterium]
MTLELKATPEEVMRAVEALRQFGVEHCLAEADIFGVTLALEECASNVVNHALKRDSTKNFQVTINQAGSELVVEVTDEGVEFDPQLAAKEASDDGPVGGWGLQLVRRYTDDLRYSRAGNKNVWRLSRRLGRDKS